MIKYIAMFISILPSNRLRVLLYRRILGLRIFNSRVGFGTIIACKSFEMLNSFVGRFCCFLGPMDVKIAEKSSIGNFNRFITGSWTQSDLKWSYEPRFLLGKNSKITSGHYFDIAASISIGDRCTIAGYGSQFWSHGPDISNKNISIGNDCCIGSAAKFCPGSAIGNRVLVGIGSVLKSNIEADDAVVAGVPAIVKKRRYDWRNKTYLN